MNLIIGTSGFISLEIMAQLGVGNFTSISLRDNDFSDIEKIIQANNSNHITIYLAAWPTHIKYDDFGHIEYWLNIVRPFISFINERFEKYTLITFGTCLEYGLLEGELSIDDICVPCTKLGAAKLMMYKYCLDTISDFRHLRIFYPYSFENPRKGTFIHYLKRAVDNNESEFDMSHGEQMRDFIEIKECVKQILDIAQKDTPGKKLYNVGSTFPIKVKDLAHRYLIYRDYKLKLNLGKIPIPWFEPNIFYSQKASTFTSIS